MINTSVSKGIQAPVSERETTIAERLNEILTPYQGKEDELIPILQQIQHVFGYIPEPAMKRIAKFLKLADSAVFGVTTFYAQFKLVPTGRNIIRVCRGTACHVRGSAQILCSIEQQLGISAGETTSDLEYSLETIACFGSCALAPVMVVNDKVYGRMTAPKVKELINKEAQ